tara:strand:+ start:623 stop:814 length:192 start_codon:yes stop_codon:yes gene_type:complete
MVDINKFDLIKLQDHNNNDIYINKKNIICLTKNQEIIEIKLIGNIIIQTNEDNLDLLADKLSL